MAETTLRDTASLIDKTFLLAAGSRAYRCKTRAGGFSVRVERQRPTLLMSQRFQPPSAQVLSVDQGIQLNQAAKILQGCPYSKGATYQDYRAVTLCFVFSLMNARTEMQGLKTLALDHRDPEAAERCLCVLCAPVVKF